MPMLWLIALLIVYVVFVYFVCQYVANKLHTAWWKVYLTIVLFDTLAAAIHIPPVGLLAAVVYTFFR
jgi:hypothetical protein